MNCRVYCMIGVYRYYWTGSFWSMWSHNAKMMVAADAEQFAKQEDGQVEVMA